MMITRYFLTFAGQTTDGPFQTALQAEGARLRYAAEYHVAPEAFSIHTETYEHEPLARDPEWDLQYGNPQIRQAAGWGAR